MASQGAGAETIDDNDVALMTGNFGTDLGNEAYSKVSLTYTDRPRLVGAAGHGACRS